MAIKRHFRIKGVKEVFLCADELLVLQYIELVCGTGAMAEKRGCRAHI